MTVATADVLPPQLAAELERKYFWWEPVGGKPRNPWRILAQAMEFASFEDMRRLEDELGAEVLVRAMLSAQPGWFSDRSWEFWRGRLALATGRSIPEEPPRRSSMPDWIDQSPKVLIQAQANCNFDCAVK